MPEPSKPQIETRPGEIVAWFAGASNAVFLSPDDARRWAKALTTAADAADALERDCG